ncbi:MAG: helix-turn-helix transcriptional regulator [Dorea sp.]|jgi:transcriptional regulator with XRE-family HTH domain|nr:helix-turn-helix transcriptional regulator [Dorea sp.]
MELGKQIKKYRGELSLSQEALAEKIYVSRQTVSNWENDKNYPDINSLLRLSEVFQVSVDILIKGDVEKMKVEIRQQDRQQFEMDSFIFSALMLATLLTPVPLLHYLDNLGIAVWVMLVSVTGFYASKVEKMKKAFDIQTYKEIIAFMGGEGLDEIAKAKEEGKRPYQKILMTAAAAFIALAVSVLMLWIFKE